MSKSAKSNLGHRRRLTHAQKRKMAVVLKTEFEQYPGVFNKLSWRKRKWAIMQRVIRRNIRAKYYAELRRGERGATS